MPSTTTVTVVEPLIVAVGLATTVTDPYVPGLNEISVKLDPLVTICANNPEGVIEDDPNPPPGADGSNP